MFIMHVDTGVSTCTGNGSGNFTKITNCSCFGESVVFSCTTFGPGLTVWSGSAIMDLCMGETITLTHNTSFTQSSGSCSDQVTARGITVNGRAHTSQLNLTLSGDLVGMTVECTLNSTDIIGNYALFDQSSSGKNRLTKLILLLLNINV